MKKLYFVLLSVVGALSTQAQVQVPISEPRPEWARQVPYPPQGANFIYVYGMGEGKTEQEAELNAWKNAFYKVFQEEGLIGIPQQNTTLDDIFSMKDLEVQMPSHVLPRRLVCQTLPIYTDNGLKIYILLQIKRKGSLPTDFYDHNMCIECESDEFLQKQKDWNSYYLKQKRKIFRKNVKATARAQSSFFTKKHNEYFVWGILNSGYPFHVSTSFFGRHGGIVGIGYQLMLGANMEKDKSRFHYTAGMRFFPYKNIYISGNYGTLAAKKTLILNDSGREEESVKLGQGYSVIIGYDLIMGKLDPITMMLSFGAGVAYDTTITKWHPALDIKLGLVWHM